MNDNVSKTEEQKEIIEELKDNNVIVEAVAGSGKTTTSLFIAKHFKELNILLLTYNSRLRVETKKRKDLWGLENLEVHTFHSFGLKHYNEKKCWTDEGLYNILNESKKPVLNYNFDLIIIDEAQDITPFYYEFICKIVTDNKIVAKLCLLGDKNQSIYSFKGADYRYLSLANQFFDFNKKNWSKCSLSETFRINDKIVDFINKVFYQKDIIRTNKKTNFLPEYVFTNTLNNNDDRFYNLVKEQVEHYGSENVFILAYSVVGGVNNPVAKLANWLTEQKIKIFRSNNDDEKIEEKDIRGKLVFINFHQAKGLERKVVIVLGFDAKYFSIPHNKDEDQNIAPNLLYVALTRASEKLILVHHNQNDFLNFLNREEIMQYSKVKDFSSSYHWNLCITKQKEFILPDKIINIGTTELTKHIQQNIINDCMKLISYSELKSEINFVPINLASHVKEEDFFEKVSMITGVAIPLYFEIICKSSLKHTDTFKRVLNLLESPMELEYPDLQTYEQEIHSMSSEQEINIKNVLLLANLWIYIVDKFNFRLKQIQNYDWITEEEMKRLADLMKNYVSEDGLHQRKYSVSEKTELYDKTLLGYIDCVDSKTKTVWEFKYVDTLQKEYFLQLAIYAYLFETSRKEQLFAFNKESCFDINSLEKGHKIEFKKHKKNYLGEVIEFNWSIIKIQNLLKLKVQKIKVKHVIRNITFEEEYKKELEKKYDFKLFNIKKNSIYKVDFKYENLQKIVGLLVWSKYFDSRKKSDIEFEKQNYEIKKKYMIKKNEQE